MRSPGAIKRIGIFLAAAAMLCAPMTAFAAAPYENYLYSVEGLPKKEPQAYVPGRVITGESLGLGPFAEPKDIASGPDGLLYLLDSGNNRVVVLDQNRALLRVLDSFVINGAVSALNGPQGIFISEKNILYIADSGNKRIVCCNLADMTATQVEKPEITMLGPDYDFVPLKLAVDSAGRMFVVVQGVNSGLVQLNADGTFNSFYGAIQTTPTLSEIFWRRFMSKEQLARQESQLPTEYNNVSIDGDGFVFGTISSIDAETMQGAMSYKNTGNTIAAVKKLNPLGSDILRRLGSYPPNGDVEITKDVSGNPRVSKIIDVANLQDGVYALLDREFGRVFTYDNDGNLLYVFGGLGQMKGQFRIPEGLAADQQNRYYVVDSGYHQVVEFVPTQYAEKVLEAVKHTFNMEYEQSEQAWSQVMEYTSNADLAYVGLGNALMRQGDYKQAMQYFRMGNNKDNFSLSFTYLREWLVQNYFVAGVVVLALLIVLWIVFKKRKGRRAK